MILASVVLVADVRDLLVLRRLVVLLPGQEVVHVLVVDVVRDVVGVLLRNLEDDLVLLFKVLVVGIDEHELVVVGHVIELLHDLVLVDDVQGDSVFLDEELGVLVLQERREVGVPPRGVMPGIHQVVDPLQLHFVVAWVGGHLRMLWRVIRPLRLSIQRELVRREWIDGHESVPASVWSNLVAVADVLDGLLKVTHGATILWDRGARILHAEHLQALRLILLLIADLGGLTEDELLAEELLQGLLLAAPFEQILLLLGEGL